MAAFCKHFAKTSPSGPVSNVEQGPSPQSVTIPLDTTTGSIIVSSPISETFPEFDSHPLSPTASVPNQTNRTLGSHNHHHDSSSRTSAFSAEPTTSSNAHARPEMHSNHDSKSGPGMAGYPAVYQDVPVRSLFLDIVWSTCI